MTEEQRSHELEALRVDARVIQIEVDSMKAENAAVTFDGHQVLYWEDAFYVKSKEMELIAKKMRGLR